MRRTGWAQSSGVHVVLHLLAVLAEHVEYYSRLRCHQSLEGNAPQPRVIERDTGFVHAIPHLGGLHHEYLRAG